MSPTDKLDHMEDAPEVLPEEDDESFVLQDFPKASDAEIILAACRTIENIFNSRPKGAMSRIKIRSVIEAGKQAAASCALEDKA